MNAFRRHTGVAVPLLRGSIDTDSIIPSREMKRVSKVGLGEGLFAGWRYHYNGARRGAPVGDFVLNRDEYRGASILLAGQNFGCGSSREHAVWALLDYWFRVVIAPSFGAIFQRNCIRNGLLPVVLDGDAVQALSDVVTADPQHKPLCVDLEKRQVADAEGRTYDFAIADGIRERLLQGLDEIDLTLKDADRINEFRLSHHKKWPWIAI